MTEAKAAAATTPKAAVAAKATPKKKESSSEDSSSDSEDEEPAKVPFTSRAIFLFRFFFKRVFWSFHPEPSDKISVGLTLRAMAVDLIHCIALGCGQTNPVLP